MEIRKFLKKIDIISRRILENEIIKAESEGDLKIGQLIKVEMTLCIKSLGTENKNIVKIHID